ncbi:hypothetical protein GCM10028794_24640 [Silanimonas algicola]
MKHGILLAALVGASACNATGFGWHACSIEWRELRETIVREKAHINDLLAGNRNPALREHFQIEADGLIVGLCTEGGAMESPISYEFYGIDSMGYAAKYQQDRGIEGSFFERFRNPQRAIQIGETTKQDMIHPVHFIVTPDDIATFIEELRELNTKTHPPRHHRQLRHLEAVMVKTANDLWGDPATGADAAVRNEYGNGQRALIFYGQD